MSKDVVTWRDELNDLELELLSSVEGMVIWLENTHEQQLINTLSDFFNFGMTRREKNAQIEYYIDVKRQFAGCGIDGREQKIRELFENELKLRAAVAYDIEKYGSLQKNYFERRYPEEVDVVEDSSSCFTGHITAVEEADMGQLRYIDYVKRAVSLNFREVLCDDFIVFCITSGIFLPSIMKKNVLRAIPFLVTCMATFSVLHLKDSIIGWRQLLRNNKEAVELFKNLGLYDMLDEYIEGKKTIVNMRKRSILEHV